MIDLRPIYRGLCILVNRNLNEEECDLAACPEQHLKKGSKM
jgi:hypothetical protein